MAYRGCTKMAVVAPRNRMNVPRDCDANPLPLEENRRRLLQPSAPVIRCVTM